MAKFYFVRVNLVHTAVFYAVPVCMYTNWTSHGHCTGSIADFYTWILCNCFTTDWA